jgi:DNA-binding MarR family transcriptional regulator
VTSPIPSNDDNLDLRENREIRMHGQDGGDAVDLRSASVTALVDRLERVGHVRRVRDAEDRRRVTLEMSDSARAAGGEHFGALSRDLVTAMGDYTDEEIAVVTRFLTEMTEVVARHARTGEDPPQR